MAVYTMTVGDLLRSISSHNSFANMWDNVRQRELIDETLDYFFNNGKVDNYLNHPYYPLITFDWRASTDQATNLKTKRDFEFRLLNHFFYDEIAYETPGVFVSHLENWLAEKMPVYSIMIGQYFNTDADHAFMTRDVKKNGTNAQTATINQASENSQTANTDQTSNGTVKTSSNGTNSNTNRSADADTPQNELDLNLNDLDYATSVNAGDGSATSSNADRSDNNNYANIANTSSGSTSGNSDSNVNGENQNEQVEYGGTGDQMIEWLKIQPDLYLDIFDQLQSSGMFMLLQ